MSTRRSGAAVAVLSLLANLLPGAVATVTAAEPAEVTFAFTGAEEQFTVPDAVTRIHVALVGADGGSTTVNTGGRGARVEGDLDVVPGTALYVGVGGRGADHRSQGAPAGFNGGGPGGVCGTALWPDGGGASDLRLVSRSEANSLDSRLMVAAGGGGAGGLGSGGDAGQTGAGGIAGGGPGTATAGGSGGTGVNTGGNGEFGVGGAGATATYCGAGGGGGFYGGGGGGADQNGYGGSGGGGSSFTGTAENATVGIDPTAGDGGSIVISYVPVLDNGTVSARVTIPTSAACLELSTSAVDFGTLPLGAEEQPGTPDITVTNCSAVDETIYARGTDASAAAATWVLDDSAATCADTLGVDAYHLDLSDGGTNTVLSTANKELQTLASGAGATRTARISTACPGSSGGGSVMTMQIVFLAAE